MFAQKFWLWLSRTKHFLVSFLQPDFVQRFHKMCLPLLSSPATTLWRLVAYEQCFDTLSACAVLAWAVSYTRASLALEWVRTGCYIRLSPCGFLLHLTFSTNQACLSICRSLENTFEECCLLTNTVQCLSTRKSGQTASCSAVFSHVNAITCTCYFYPLLEYYGGLLLTSSHVFGIFTPHNCTKTSSKL